ncbi:MAG: trypsin-like peptidase domain-containing protein [Chlamydiales bacterium]|nr:trypsin-like peptidase domain-containing protein [Chlamydiales bacterium]
MTGITAATATAHLTPQQQNIAVFNSMRTLIRRIFTLIGNTSVAEATGFFLERDVVVTVAHNSLANGILQSTCYHEGTGGLMLEPAEEMNLKNAHALDMLCFYSEIDLPEESLLREVPEGFVIEEGMEVYYAGFPFGRNKITFHKGMISSVSEENGFREFTIDGTVVHGNSGGPVVVLIDGKPHILGIITSEMADFYPEDLKTIQCMKMLNQHFKEHPPAEVSHISGVVTTQAGIKRTFTVRQGGQEERLDLTDAEVMTRSLDLIQRNLSSGIGRAVDIRDCTHLFSEEIIEGAADPRTYYEPLGYRSEIELRALLQGQLTTDKTLGRTKAGKIKTSKEDVAYIKTTYPEVFAALVEKCVGKGGLHKFTNTYSVFSAVDSDHTIPHDVWKTTTNPKLKDHVRGKEKRPGERHMPAITIPHEIHEQLGTTASSAAAVAFRAEVTDLCDQDKIPDALIKCFREYERCGINLKSYQEGLLNMLNEYVKMKVITDTELANIKTTLSLG